MSVTLKDIAKAAGVHQTVVSVVLNNKKYTRVSAERRDHIRRIAEEMGYRPNLQAASLRGRKKATVGVFLPPWRDVLLLELIKGLSSGSNEYEIPLTFYFGMSSESYCRFIDSMTSCRHTGIISYVPFWDRDYERILSKLETYIRNGGKVISLNTLGWPMQKTITLDIDDEYGGKIAAEYLLEKKVSSYGLFGIDMKTHELRENGFCRELDAHSPGTPIHRFQIDTDHLERNLIFSEIETMLNAVKLPVGIMTSCTEFTSYLIRACEQRNWTPGKEFELVGYDLAPRYGDAIPVARVVQPFFEMGSIAMEKLYRLLIGDDVQSEILKPILKRGDDI